MHLFTPSLHTALRARMYGRWAPLAQLLLPRYVPRAGKEMLLHLAFWARVEKMHASDSTPSVTVAFLDLHKNYEEIGAEMITIPVSALGLGPSHSPLPFHSLVRAFEPSCGRYCTLVVWDSTPTGRCTTL